MTFSLLATDASTAQGITIVSAVDSPTAGGEVEIGDTVKSIFCEINIAAETITNPKILHWQIVKQPNSAISFPSPALYDQTTKKFVIKRGMEMLPKSVSTVTKRIFVVRIPRIYQRQGDLDKIIFRFIVSSNETVNVCGFFIFRHFG